ncbi:PE family protein [Mycobacterium kansasii 732]|uniref:Putative PE-PGRS family protein PE_PGRS24 n=1 Tax=Mycobacterium pseudokansasii TaxID=2341080 RepID=A0A498QSC8_9MYCO|nr:PE family protein [Mycobacterium kansasii 732]VBA49901.1 putative PE-PGRS family protein PE_PGRS24 [Mycobacterium pseudokansasii]
MSYVIATPETVAAAATDLRGISAALRAANVAAAGPTTALPAAGADEVSAAIAALFAGHAEAYQAASVEAAGFHARLVQALKCRGWWVCQRRGCQRISVAEPAAGCSGRHQYTDPSAAGPAAHR